MTDGKVIKTPISNLSDEDQLLLKKVKESGPDAIPSNVDHGDINPDYLPPSPWPIVDGAKDFDTTGAAAAATVKSVGTDVPVAIEDVTSKLGFVSVPADTARKVTV